MVPFKMMRPFLRFFSVKANLQNNPIQESGELFKIKLNEQFASVTYEKIDESTYDLIHSDVPEEYAGQGFGGILAQRVFDHLVENDKKIKVTCDFLQKFLDKNKKKYGNYIVD